MNQLINEKSPYLLQHAHNPVHWQPWGDDAFMQATATHKPVLVSIGYAACHWCHVMERESFEDEEVAAFMNAHFICIKVDREEHPDVDHLYMDALQAISGSGGWPLNMFTTPDKLPFYGGTYFPPVPAHGRVSWMQLLQRIVALWEKQQDDVEQQAQQMVAHLKNASSIGKTKNEHILDEAFCRRTVATLLANADTTDGGFGRAPKFPGTMAISFLLEHYRLYGDTTARWQALLSLDKMIQGGIYDQIGGGFARYSVDDEWLAPHFEKMLYDNALLICSLSDAYLLTQNPRYKTVIQDTISFLNRELKDESGLYYSAIDADSEGVEGKFYTWTADEWYNLFGHEYDHIAAFYGVTGDGNWEHTNILHTKLFAEEFAEIHNMDVATVKKQISFVNEKLMFERSKRQRPITDDKSLLSWNALMNIALTRAGIALQHDGYIQQASEHAAAMLSLFYTPAGLMHTWKQNEARIAANLDDYTYLVQALIQTGTVTADFALVKKAEQLMEETLAKFASEDNDLLYFSSQEKDLPVRKVEVYDGAVPSANAVHTHNLVLLGFIAEKGEWLRKAETIISNMKNHILHSPYSFGYWATLAQRSVAGWKMVICTGAEGEDNVRELRRSYFPQTMAFTFQKQISEYPGLQMKYLKGDSFIFVCNETECLPPVNRIKDAVSLLENRII